MIGSLTRMVGTSRVRIYTSDVAIPGPVINVVATPSGGRPSIRNRPSGPVVALKLGVGGGGFTRPSLSRKDGPLAPPEGAPSGGALYA